MNDFGGNRILVVEPDSWARHLLVEFFVTEGFDVEAAKDSGEAQACTVAFDPQVAVVNFHLGAETSGGQLALALRQINSMLNFVFMSKLSLPDLTLLPGSESLAGAQYCSLGNDFHVDELLGSVQRALARVAP